MVAVVFLMASCYPNKTQMMVFSLYPLCDLNYIKYVVLLYFCPGYFAHMACLNNLLSMSKQLIGEIQNADAHKYISYETALLHVSMYYHYVYHEQQTFDGHSFCKFLPTEKFSLIISTCEGCFCPYLETCKSFP